MKKLIFIIAIAGLAVWGGFAARDYYGGKPLARVGKYKITQKDFDKKLAEVSNRYQNYLLTPNGRKQFMDILIREKTIVAAAADSGIGGSRKYREEVAAMKEDMEARLRDFREYLLTKSWIEDLKANGILKVTDAETKDYYEQHPLEITIEHILMGSADEAQGVLKKIREGAGFTAMARANSIDADTAEEGGRLPPFIYGEFLPDMEDVAFRMKTGEIEGVFKSRFGYHILRKTGERKIEFSEAKSRIVKLLEKKKLDDYLLTLGPKYKVEVYDEQYKYN